MAKRQSEAARVLNYFETAPLETAQTIFDLVRDKMKKRRGPQPNTARKPSKSKASSGDSMIAMGGATPSTTA